MGRRSIGVACCCAACGAEAAPADAQHHRHKPWNVHSQSACSKAVRISDFYPMRSPLVVADFLAERIRGMQAYAEIGTRDGDCVACVATLARVRAFAIEQSAQRCRNLRRRGGFDVIEGQVNESSYRQLLPTADVYYFWIEPPVVLELVGLIHRALHERGREAAVYVGYDWHRKDDRKAFVEHVEHLTRTYGLGSVSVDRLFFDEHPEETSLLPSRNVSLGEGYGHRPNPSYARRYAGRPGAWGVFHLVGARVGAAGGAAFGRTGRSLDGRTRIQH